MFKNYLKIAWRNFKKGRLYSIINLSGLTIGMTSFILIALFVQYELSYDKQHENVDDIYRVISKQPGNEFKGTDLFSGTPLPLGTAMVSDFPEVEAKTGIDLRSNLLNRGEEVFNEKGIFADRGFFDVFTVKLISGVGKSALEDPLNVLLTESLAKKFFGSESPLNQTITFNRSAEFTIKGVIADPPKNQHFNYSYIASISAAPSYLKNSNAWGNNAAVTYVKLAQGTDFRELEAKLLVYRKHPKEAYAKEGLKPPIYKLQPLKDIHLYSKVNFELTPNGDMKYVYLYSLIAFVILLLASINYMNLTTVRSAQRAREIGMTKVLGANRQHLIAQFLGESFLFTIFSFLLALGLAFLLLPEFGQLLDKNIPFDIVGNKWLLPGMFCMAIIVGSLSGLYPAVFLSSVSPIKAFKGNFLKNKGRNARLRNGLVVGQFTTATVLAIGSLIIYQQLQFTQNKNLGYDKEHIVHVTYSTNEIAENEAVIRNELLKNSRINKVSISSQIPLDFDNQGPIYNWEGNTNKEQLGIYRAFVDYDFIDVLGMEIVEGRAFSEDFATDEKEAYIINETAAKSLGWKTSVGKEFDDGHIIGVVKDFHIQKFDLAIEPLYMRMRPQWAKTFGEVIMTINPNNFEETKKYIISVMNEAVPLVPFDVKFLDDTYAQLYNSEVRLGSTFNIFTMLALFIASIGMFGLVSHSVIQRTKEIGIRKVLGSSTVAIVLLVSKDFLKLVVIALLVAFPIAYYFMNDWLQGFAYRIEIDWWVFVLVGFISLIIAMVTISFQSIKAAKANPVKSLRTE
ncbi:ABC transporter permease [Aurantibacter crassamenti]|uniref:ABC transporter permease n=1 Tax=Aurantibacter crassamenti TaxID=1837375 RepID=UPI001939DBEA|nr:ABC transporter permease [Aurantibacter crassamenti]MBM1106515.1 ABC transporter permease [Aurantibacter crassamenti]